MAVPRWAAGVTTLNADAYVASVADQTTGGEIWPAARKLLAWFEASNAERVGLLREGVACLELGSGTGWLGLAVAAKMHATSTFVLTEYDQGMRWLRMNMAANAAHVARGCSVKALELNWLWFLEGLPEGHEAVPQVVGRAWDFIVGSDLVYSEAGAKALPACLASLAGPKTTVFYAHTLRRFDVLDAQLFRNFADAGFAVYELGELYDRTALRRVPAPSPAILDGDLFPEQRQVVLELKKDPRAPDPCAH